MEKQLDPWAHPTCVALPTTTIALPAHIFEDQVLGQSLLSISDITKQDYTATFRKNGLYLYHDNDLVHFSPKTTDATAWTLPIQRPLEHANAVISLPSDKKFVEFTNASLGSPVQYVQYERDIYQQCHDLPRSSSAGTRPTLSLPRWDTWIALAKV